MKSRKETIRTEKIDTSSGSIQKITLPYLDWHINPNDLDFNEEDPAKSVCSEAYQLGSGAFGTVYIAQNPKTLEWMAVKKYKPETSNEEIEEEIKALQTAKLYLGTNSAEKTIFMKFLPGHELFESMMDEEKGTPQKLSFLQKTVIGKGILKKLADLHHDVEKMKAEMLPENKDKIIEKIVTFHEDIKPENIRVDFRDLSVRFCDYAFAQSIKEPHTRPVKEDLSNLSRAEFLAKLADTKPTISTITGPPRGTIAHLAPEILLDSGDKTYNEKSEIYAVGVTLAMLYNLEIADARFKNFPRPYSSRLTLVDESNPIAQVIPYRLYELISRMMDDDPEMRPTAVEATILYNQILDKAAGPLKPDERDDGKEGEIKTYPMNVGVISIDGFLKMEEEEKQQFIDDIIDQDINAVVLQGSENTTNKAYYEVCRYLNRERIISIAPFIATPDQHLSDDKKEEATYRIAKDHYDQRLATVNTQVFFYDCEQNEFIEKKGEQFDNISYDADTKRELKYYVPTESSSPSILSKLRAGVSAITSKFKTRTESSSSSILPMPDDKTSFALSKTESSSPSILSKLRAKTSSTLSKVKKGIRSIRKTTPKDNKDTTDFLNHMDKELLNYSDTTKPHLDPSETQSEQKHDDETSTSPHNQEMTEEQTLLKEGERMGIEVRNWNESDRAALQERASTSSADIPDHIGMIHEYEGGKIQEEVEKALACLKNNKEFYYLLNTDDNNVFRKNNMEDPDFKAFYSQYEKLIQKDVKAFFGFRQALAGTGEKPALMSPMNEPTSDEAMKKMLAVNPNYRQFLIDNAHHPAIENWYERNPQPTREKKPDTVEGKHPK